MTKETEGATRHALTLYNFMTCDIRVSGLEFQITLGPINRRPLVSQVSRENSRRNQRERNRGQLHVQKETGETGVGESGRRRDWEGDEAGK